MPELPEVETTRRGIAPFLLKQTISKIHVRQPQLRLPINVQLTELCPGQQIHIISRRAKYLLLHLTTGYVLIHLGMSGHLSLINKKIAPGKHDHIDLILNNGLILRYSDPRRFGLWLYIKNDPYAHPLLAKLGPEPLSEAFNAQYLWQCSQQKKQSIKSLIMNNAVVVGIGNIYAAESLFLASIHPLTPAGMLNKISFSKLVTQIKAVLNAAINAGGTTLRDFYAVDGKAGYFANNLQVYGRKNLSCYYCNSVIQAIIIAGRNSFFCPSCQQLPD